MILFRGVGLRLKIEVAVNRCLSYMHLYVPDNASQVELSYLGRGRFYEGAQAQAH